MAFEASQKVKILRLMGSLNFVSEDGGRRPKIPYNNQK